MLYHVLLLSREVTWQQVRILTSDWLKQNNTKL